MLSVLTTRKLIVFRFIEKHNEVARVKEAVNLDLDDYQAAQVLLSFILTTTRNIKRLVPHFSTSEWQSCKDSLLDVINESQPLIKRATSVKSRILEADHSAISEARAMQDEACELLIRMRHAIVP